ncbi:glutathione S-transferase domain-containing protein [Clathrospora elynae]|uniref:Glutathione S-transferase domain-containing protein n=1 Tax=Clathrospora elynae TaxID=706981 RepID=A0A6A5ST47_9PLEO|nr:glutathione S-transferase domain-containing protein [Clathrospora elynae]
MATTTTTTEEPLTLISATPSPFARMNRIALALKAIPFNLQNEIPWESTTETPRHNPLEKLPILIFPASDGRSPVYDSAHIQEYIVRKFPDRGPKLVTGDVDLDLEIRQIVVLSEGCLDAIVLSRWEGRREEGKQSRLWIDRQNRKIDGAMRAFDFMVSQRRKEGKEYLVGEELSIADIAVVCTVGFVDFGALRPRWKDEYVGLKEWFEKLDGRKEFSETRPVMFDLKESVV